MTAEQLTLKWVDPATLDDNPSNWRRHPEGQLKALSAVLADPEIGWAGVLLYNETTGHLIDGHARKEAAIKRGDKAVPVVMGKWTEAAEKKILLTLDPLAAMAEADPGILRSLMEAVDLDSDELEALLDDLGDTLKAADLAETQGKEITEDEAPAESEVESRCQPGDLWTLGEHRLLCGDSTKAKDVTRLLDGRVPFIMVTDPPYGVEYDPEWRLNAGLNKEHQVRAEGKVENDDQFDWTETYRLFPGDVAYVWHGGKHAAPVAINLLAAAIEIRTQVIWRKASLVISRGHYHWQHEPCWYAVRKGRTAKWCGGRKQSTIWDIPNMHRTQGDVDDGKTAHSTQKPVECMARPIRNHGGKDDDVYDPFLGSGTTIIAAEQLGRRCYGMEISPKYCDIILARWEKLTGKKAERVSAAKVEAA